MFQSTSLFAKQPSRPIILTYCARRPVKLVELTQVAAQLQLKHSLTTTFPRLVFDCSAGVGRTGCFIVIDAMLERIKHEKTVDIYGHVTLMRAQRNYMVQTEDQYVFIHDALQEAVNCGTTEVPARNLYAYIQKLTQIEGGENVTGMELEFKVKKS